ncbi:UNVERIFIED_CONTAM: hypothetical protein FKN15_009465 [Acipenser sinensis]
MNYYRTLQLQGIAQPRPFEEAGLVVRMPGLQEPRSCQAGKKAATATSEKPGITL